MTQQYSLRWNNHQPNFISMFTTLLNTQTLVDVTLAAEGKHLQAHKVVLSACSTYFQALFMENPSRHPIVILKDVTFADLRTMVDFMYYGEVNVTEDQLPQVLDTAKTLKIKGLTEMPDSTSLTRSQGTSADFPSGEMSEQRHNASPVHSPRRRKRRRSSTGSLGMAGERGTEADGGGGGGEERGGGAELVRGDVTLSSVPQRRREYHDTRAPEHQQQQQPSEPHNLNVQQLSLETDASGLPQGGQWNVMEHPYVRGNVNLSRSSLTTKVMSYSRPGKDRIKDSNSMAVKLRRTKYFKRQSRVAAEDPLALPKQYSEPAPAQHQPTLQKHESYPQYEPKSRRVRTQDPEVGSILIRAVTVLDRQPSSGPSTSIERDPLDTSVATTRASHTPAVRSGPPLSCNFCWNTVDECGRILRRKTQYHCPECRTNLCIVPCFHEYHDGNDTDAAASAR